MKAGQAMVEYALLLPLQLLLLLGMLQVGLALVVRSQLVHAAQVGASAGAGELLLRCDRAREVVEQVYGSEPDRVDCSPAPVLTVSLADAAPAIPPWPAWTIEAVGRAVGP